MGSNKTDAFPLWQPTLEQVTSSHMTRFAVRYTQCEPSNYAELLQWSIDNPGQFWSSVWDYGGVTGSKGKGPYFVHSERLQGCQWFPEAKLNYAENLLQRRDKETALVFRSEDRDRRVVSYEQLYSMVAKCSHFLREQNVTDDDVVAGFMPNTIETVVAMLAATSLGAAWCSCSPDFGIDGAYDRFQQVKPKVLFTVDGYIWKGKKIAIANKTTELATRLQRPGCLQQLVEVPFMDLERNNCACDRAISWSQALENSARTVKFEKVGFNHPLFVMFSSGTTGLPKCIVHRVGGVLLQHIKEHQLHCNIRKNDKVFFYTTCGWMMWNWTISALASQVRLILYDGSPLHPSADILWEIAEEEEITFFGTSAKYLQATEKAGVKPGENFDISSLRTIASTGSPLMSGSYDYVYQDISPNVHLASISGGTDIISCFVLGNPCLPIYKGEIQCAGLGLHVAVADENNSFIRKGKGELVCRNAFPCMPLCFGNDPDGEKYHAAYFEARPGMWAHSDFAEIREHSNYQSFVIHGRFDSTLNPGGVRIGTAEIYRQVEKFSEVVESVVIGKKTDDDDVEIVLFVVLTDGCKLTDELAGNIRQEIKINNTPRHVPAAIVQVSDIPKTRNGKIAEVAVRDVVNGKEVANTQALANPESLKEFATIE